jgi:hypothetical protein|tara:strand:+ start:405 stop:587 length:183 start_codon:yes stop_codon:yes gene_type:complete
MENIMTITDAKYKKAKGVNKTVSATVDGDLLSIPMDPDNRHYAEILRQVDAGTLTIAAAD